MKILKFRQGQRTAFGALQEGGRVRLLKGSPFERGIEVSDEQVRLADVSLLAPTVDHPRIFGVGLNYKTHIQETGRATPEIPSVFMKPDTSLLGHGGAIVYPRVAQLVHYETELVAVIGRRAKGVQREEAMQFVLGCTCGNDVSERIYQRKEMAMGLMTVGKAFDTFAPIGPWIDTEVDPSRLHMQGRLNGTVVQDCDTSDLLFGVDALVAYLSTFITLMPGDLIMTGTPGGVGPLQPGDTFEVDIAGIGTLSNTVVAQEGEAA
jgi:2-keto-4-pentenoate hydratase/2-oxohepta-3-ene-1,7-dioic acid hydratase in catechol pathway